MNHQPKQTIPWIDMGSFFKGTPQQKIETAQHFGQALLEIGFVAVTNIGIKTETIDRAYAIAEHYFNQSDAVKMKTHTQAGHHGFMPFGTEHAKYTTIVDLKEFYQTTGPTQPESCWPEFPQFKTAMNALYDELEMAMKYCLEATAIFLGYEEEPTILSNYLGRGNGVMRIIHYPPVDLNRCPPGAVRSAPHEDLGLMTVIPRATRSGLQVLNKSGEWLDVVVPPNAAIVNSADTLTRITNGIIPSTTHRVINPHNTENTHRYSVPFFGNIAPNTILRVLDKCRGKSKAAELPPEVTFAEFMAERYKEIGIRK